MDETSFDAGVEPSVMFDELNKTQMNFPPETNKAEKNQAKLKELEKLAKKTHVSFPETMKKKEIHTVMTGADFYKDILSSEQKRKKRS